MPFITWNEEYSVNIKEIDAQHKKLIELINNLFDKMRIGRGKDVIGIILNELVNYTVYHFITEEKLLQEHRYPEYMQHKKLHSDLTKQVKELKDKFDHGDIIVTARTMNFLNRWLIDHIMGEDKKYSPFLNSKGVG
ncbi:MAG: bacteriohemerythrin [Nitrospirae bacterium]|nr:bacteriohemerythrin [Nitrospirota bacterium]